MSMDVFSTDQLESRLVENRRLMSQIEAEQMTLLEELDRRQVATGDGCRSMAEWVSLTLDVGRDTARNLVRTMNRTSARPDLRSALADGVSFDRVEALSRIQESVGLWEAIDVEAVRREAAKRAGTVGDEFKTGDDRFLVLQPSLDEGWWKLWGGLDGPSGALVDKVLSEAADDLSDLPDDSPTDAAWRRATALVQLCVTDNPPPANVTVFVDAAHAASSNGLRGVVLEAGPVVARDALQAILCDSVLEVTARSDDGTYMNFGRTRRTAPPALSRALHDKYAGACAADGCTSRNRLQAHHIVPWSQGGATDQDNLVLLCWYHHHIVVHEKGFIPYPHHDHGRIRFRRSETAFADRPL